MLVIHRASEPPKLTVRAPAPAHRVWAVRLVVALLVVLLVVSNTALGAGLKRPGGHPTNRGLREKARKQREWRNQQDLKPSQQDEPSQVQRPFLHINPAQADGRQDGRRSGDAKFRALWEKYAWQESPRLKDGRFALPKLNKLESDLPAQQVYRLTKEILQQHPVKLLERDADGRFQSIPKFETTSSDANIFSELRKRHTTAMTDVLAWAAHNKISALQSSVSPTQSGSGKLKLSVPDLRQSLLDLPIGEKSVATPSVDQKDGFSGTNLPEVSSLEVHGDSPNTLLDIKLKPKEGQVDKYVVGRAHLDKMINTINTAMDPFLNAP